MVVFDSTNLVAMVFLIPVIGISSNGFSGALNFPAFLGACGSSDFFAYLDSDDYFGFSEDF